MNMISNRGSLLTGLAAIAAAITIMALVSAAGKTSESALQEQRYEPCSIVQDYAELDEWQIFLMALMEEESGYDSGAVSDHDARGVLQITPVYVQDVNRICGSGWEPEDVHNDTTALDCFAVYQDHYNEEHDIDRAIRLHNPGAGKAYRDRIKMRMETIRRMEQVRALLVNY